MGNTSLKCFNAVLFCAWIPCLVFTLNNFYVKVKSTLPLNIESLMETGKRITHCAILKGDNYAQHCKYFNIFQHSKNDSFDEKYYLENLILYCQKITYIV